MIFQKAKAEVTMSAKFYFSGIAVCFLYFFLTICYLKKTKQILWSIGMIRKTSLFGIFFVWLTLFFLKVAPAIAVDDRPEALVTTLFTNTVFAIDIGTQSVILPGISVPFPLSIALTPDNNFGVVCGTASHTVSIIDLNSQTVVGTVTVGHSPNGIAITPDNRLACISNSNAGAVSIIDLNSQTVVGTVTVGDSPKAIAITPDNRLAWVCNSGDNTVSIIDLNAQIVVGTVSVGDSPEGIAITPDNTLAWVCNSDDDAVSIIDLISQTVIGTVDVGNSPKAIAITPDNTLACVCNSGSASNSVSIIDLISRTVVGTVDVGSSPQGIAITPDNKHAWVSNFFNTTVSIIDLSSQTVVGTVDVGSAPTGIAITPDQAPTANFSYTISGVAVSFNASESFSPFGEIATYQWNFGDGSPVETVSSPTISHTYANSGTFTVTLIVTNTSGTSTQQTFTGQTVSNNGGPSAEQQQQVVVSLEVLAPRKFTGKPKIHKKSKKLDLKTQWKKSLTQNILRYELFAHKHKIASIAATRSLKKKLRLHPQHFPSHHLSKDYRTYLHHKYSIRAIDTNGKASAFTYLYVRQ
jgi:YVTN family beta-propeller protein